MVAAFRPTANLFAQLALWFIALLLVFGLCLWFFWPNSDPARRLGIAVEQPVPFSHEHHVGGLGIDCRFCHTSVEVSSNAGMPPTYTCMTCHSQIWTNAKLLAPVRQSLISHKPLVWRRVTDLPDYVYFNHSIHIAKGVGCSSCHGAIARMPLTYKAETMTMQFCLACHLDPGPRLRPRAEIYNTEYQPAAGAPTPQQLMDQYRIGSRKLTDCSICHR
jgi:hypothetical protein